MSALLHGAMRGVIAAMAMTGMRSFATHAGLIREDPPTRLTRKKARGLLRLVPRRRRGAVVAVVHWTMGAVFGVVFALLPERIRRRAWSGPVYGVLVWLGFDSVVAPSLGLTGSDWPHARERAVFLCDHALFGLVLDEMRMRAQE